MVAIGVTYAKEHELATTDQFDSVDGNQSRQEILGSVASSQQLRVIVVGQVDLLEQDGCLRRPLVLSSEFFCNGAVRSK